MLQFIIMMMIFNKFIPKGLSQLLLARKKCALTSVESGSDPKSKR